MAALNIPTLAETLSNARQRLLSERNTSGQWEGELSSSALSTATALFALHLYAQASPGEGERYRPLILGGVEWLTRTQNPDGGWGDTTLSLSNISTTALCWAALTAVEADARARDAAGRWLAQAAGSLEPDALARAIIARYGKDRTFSVPILTMCTLAGALGSGAAAWDRIPQLPFELAACPHQWFSWLKLPVVSYALPALIAMGQVRHHHRPTRNPAAGGVRRLTRAKTLRVLQEIQPTGGGYLEATPLTSFVTMSLVGAGAADHAVTRAGVDFLVRSVRPDGSWPIDTNLATWVTTLSINALAADAGKTEPLPVEERQALRDWLLGQQYRVEHPYTHAAPGGWAWTDLPGGVPDADDTPGALLALHHLGLFDADVLNGAEAGIQWLLGLQNRDGGMPTFCRGWGALPFDRSGADLTAHALLAWRTWKPHLAPVLQQRLTAASQRALAYLAKAQRADGAWVPLWFGNQFAPEEDNPTYGTARVLLALEGLAEDDATVREMQRRGMAWLRRAQNGDGGWGGDLGVGSTIEETALAVQALCGIMDEAGAVEAIVKGAAWLVRYTEGGRSFEPSPIGFYFAKLWYYERLYPLIFTVAALERATAVLHHQE